MQPTTQCTPCLQPSSVTTHSAQSHVLHDDRHNCTLYLQQPLRPTAPSQHKQSTRRQNQAYYIVTGTRPDQTPHLWQPTSSCKHRRRDQARNQLRPSQKHLPNEARMKLHRKVAGAARAHGACKDTIQMHARLRGGRRKSPGPAHQKAAMLRSLWLKVPRQGQDYTASQNNLGNVTRVKVGQACVSSKDRLQQKGAEGIPMLILRVPNSSVPPRRHNIRQTYRQPYR